MGQLSCHNLDLQSVWACNGLQLKLSTGVNTGTKRLEVGFAAPIYLMWLISCLYDFKWRSSSLGLLKKCLLHSIGSVHLSDVTNELDL